MNLSICAQSPKRLNSICIYIMSIYIYIYIVYNYIYIYVYFAADSTGFYLYSSYSLRVSGLASAQKLIRELQAENQRLQRGA